MFTERDYQVDWNLVAQEAGFKNAKVASTRFGQMKNKFITKNSNSAPTTPTTSFTSTTTVADTPTPSPSKKVKEVGSGTNVSSGRVKKTPVKGNGMTWGPKVKIRSRVGAENEDDEVVGSFVGGGGKGEDEEYMGEI